MKIVGLVLVVGTSGAGRNSQVSTSAVFGAIGTVSRDKVLQHRSILSLTR